LVRRRRRRIGVAAGGLTPAFDEIFASDLRGSHHLRPGSALGWPAGRRLLALLADLLLLAVLLGEGIRRRLLPLSSLLILLLLLLLLLLLHDVVFSFLGAAHLLLMLRAFVAAPRLTEVGFRKMALTQLPRRLQMTRLVVALVLIW